MNRAALPRMPSQSSAIGIQAIGAIERSESTIGAKARSIRRKLPMTSPSGMPAAAPMARPIRTRRRLPAAAAGREPSASVRMAAETMPLG